MTEKYLDEFAIVRAIPNTFQACVTIAPVKPAINVELAKQQHTAYCKTLEELGLKLIRIEADDALPDCCFTEDTVILFGDLAIITKPGTPSRIAETVEM
ncbi:MAG: hypothetical protein WAU24_01500, partial [Chitinophagaceae bacterium]